MRQQLAGNHRASFLVLLGQRADLSGAAALRDHANRVAFGYQRLTATATRSQAGLRALLRSRRAHFEPFWIVNAILVRDAGPALAGEIAARPEVARIRALGGRRIQMPRQTRASAAAAGVEWNLDRIRASQVWQQLGVRGEGIVVANIDTGVQLDHPALVRHYRGYRGDGTFDHDHNWYDPSRVCGGPVSAPCDNVGHGTHTMGTMVGDDGAGNQIGVAPGATWIAAKGCETDFCSDTALLAAGQWVIAPTDSGGQNPRPDLAPHIVSNSWGGSGGDGFYQAIVDRWVQVGIFPVFANGNNGPGCDTSGSPGDYPDAYSVGAFDRDNHIADFSARGPSAFGDEVKPNIAAPGVDVRSSVPGGYALDSGTSMATPHVAGAVALLWSAAPSLIGDIAGTRRLLDQTATDTDDRTCGGTATDNDVWGQGRLDAFAAVQAAPRAATGTLAGTVTDAGSHQPLQGATVRLAGQGDTLRAAITDAAGAYRFTPPAGAYQLTAGRFGYAPVSATVQVSAGQTATRNVGLAPLPRHAVAGHVRDDGGLAVTGATVRLDNTPLPPVATGADGTFRLENVPDGQYDIAVAATRCVADGRRRVAVDGDTTADVALAPLPDHFGYTCHATAQGWVNGTAALPLAGDDEVATVQLPFAFRFYGSTYRSAYVSTNGFLNFLKPLAIPDNNPLPYQGPPNAAIYPFWDDLVLDGSASARTALVGQAPNRQFAIEWRNAGFFDDPSARVSFEVLLGEDGDLQLRYTGLSDDARGHGGQAVVGIENADGTVGLQYAAGQPLLVSGAAITFSPPPGTVQGTVTGLDGAPLQAVTVQATRAADGGAAAQAQTDSGGAYLLSLPLGDYLVRASKQGSTPATSQISIFYDGQVVTQDFTLGTGTHVVSGVVRDSGGNPVAGAAVELPQTSVPAAVTAVDGAYRMEGVPDGDFDLIVTPDPCLLRSVRQVAVHSDVTADVVLVRVSDQFGYQCRQTTSTWVDATDVLPLSGDDTSAPVTLPFAFPFYGQGYGTAYVASNGFLDFLQPRADPTPRFLPNPDPPNAAVYPLWQDLTVDASASVRTALVGQSPRRQFVVEWRNVLAKWAQARVTFEAVLGQDGHILLQYKTVGTNASALSTVGIEDQSGTVGLQYSLDHPLVGGLALLFQPPAAPGSGLMRRV